MDVISPGNICTKGVIFLYGHCISEIKNNSFGNESPKGEKKLADFRVLYYSIQHLRMVEQYP
jgi:hypothetical protein